MKHFAMLLAVAGALCAQPAVTPRTELLWPNGAPGAMGNEDLDKPTLAFYLPAAARAVGTAVVVCPGGGYQHLSMDREGEQIARWLNSFGVTAFVLKYRLGPRYHHPAPLQDVQRAIRYARLHAREIGFAPDRIGVWGFSAGGHLASTAGTHFDRGKADAADPIDRQGSRPDFLILAYPVVTMELDYTHRGSRLNLLGENPDPQLVAHLSNEKQVTAQTPPTFLFHTTDDPAVPVENSLQFYMALRKAGVPAEMHIYEHGAHGASLAATDRALSGWPDHLAVWMELHGLLMKP